MSTVFGRNAVKAALSLGSKPIIRSFAVQSGTPGNIKAAWDGVRESLKGCLFPDVAALQRAESLVERIIREKEGVSVLQTRRSLVGELANVPFGGDVKAVLVSTLVSEGWDRSALTDTISR